MADSNRLAVLKDIQTALRAIGAGYNYPVASASQVTLDPTVNLITGAGLPDLPAYVVEPTPNGSKEYYPAEQLKEEFVVNVLGRMDADPADPTSKATTWENMAADIEKALELDTTRSGHACDTRLLVPQPFTGVGSNIVIIVQPVRVTMYRKYADGVGS
jgi:hypothetical protein